VVVAVDREGTAEEYRQSSRPEGLSALALAMGDRFENEGER
jgi:hypothetical protein